MPFIPRNERPSLALLAGLEEEQASELSGALSTAADEIDGEQLVRHVIDRTPSMEARDVKRVLKAVRQIASAREALEAQPEAFLNDIAEQPVVKVPAAFEQRCIPPDCVVRRLRMPNMRPPHALSGGRLAALGATRDSTTGCEGMGEVEEEELRLDEARQRRLRDRLTALTASPAMWMRRRDAAEYVHYPTRAGDRSELRRCFEKHADEWKTRTAHLSVLSQRIMHPSYQRIIGLGRDALPLIIERLSTHPDHWFWALRSISGEDPVRREDEGRFGAMRDAWIRWGRNRGLI